LKPQADHFSVVARAYASCRPRYPDELFTYLATLCCRHELAWDCAAGSGQATLPLARSFRRVVATDASKAMLRMAPPHPAVEYWVATAEASPLRSTSADLLAVAQALHWLDLESFYLEVERVLIPGGILAVWTYGNQTLDEPALDGILRRFYHEVVGPYWAPERRHVESGYRTLPFPFPELEPPTFTMEHYWTLPEVLGYVGTWSATQRFREVMGQDPVEILAEELAPLWQTPTSPRCIRWPLSIRLGRRPV
jgi:SAM-dependent methyltransferase